MALELAALPAYPVTMLDPRGLPDHGQHVAFLEECRTAVELGARLVQQTAITATQT